MAVVSALVPISVSLYIFTSMNDAEAIRILNTTIENSTALLDFQPALLMPSYNLYTSIFLAFSLLTFVLFAVLLGAWLTYQNICYSLNTQISYSENTKNKFKFMLQTTAIQMCLGGIFTVPATIFAALTVLPTNLINTITQTLDFITKIIESLFLPELIVCSMCLTSLYPMCSIISILIVITPYRHAVKRILFYLPDKLRQRKITVVASSY